MTHYGYLFYNIKLLFIAVCNGILFFFFLISGTNKSNNFLLNTKKKM
jgi:hypothetical protein